MIPYFYTCIAIMVTDIFNSYYLNHDCSIDTITKILSNDLLRSFFASGAYTVFGTVDIGTRIGAIWFLPAMFFATIIFQLLLEYMEDDRTVGILSGAIALAGYISAKFIWLPFSVQSGMMASFFIWIGYYIKKQRLLDQLKWYHYVIAQLILLFGISNNYCSIAFVVADISDMLLSIPVGLSGCLLIYLISKIDLKGRVLEYIGKISLAVLCTHLYALETMGAYLNIVLDKAGLSGNSRVWAFILEEIFFAVCTAFAIETIKKRIKTINERLQERHWGLDKRRDVAIDVAKGLFIIMMLIGHFKIDSVLRSIIYSCHMIAFVVFSGYFYKRDRSLWKSVVHIIHIFLFPYLIFVFCSILMSYQNINYTFLKEICIRYLLGMSFSQNLFSDIPSVGTVYFILMLAAIRLIYLFVDHGIKSEELKLLVVACISLLGMKLGRNGFWMPWSIDIACYAMIFYQIGIYFRKYDLLAKVRDFHLAYFILTLIWVYMIYMGSMEIAVRNYGRYGLVILGSVAGVLLVYKLSAYISGTLPVITKFLTLISENSMVILIVHTLLDGVIRDLLAYRFNSENVLYMIGVVLLQIAVSWIIKEVILKARMTHLKVSAK